MNIVSKTLGRLVARITGRTAQQEQPAAVADPFVPSVAEVEQAACDYTEGAELARQGEALKRKARKVLGRVPSGTYGTATITRKANSRITDKAAMEAKLKALGEPLPMMDRAPTLVVEVVEISEPAPAVREWSVDDLLADLDSKLTALAA
ncbi:hypothetical protein ACFWP3_17075 [Streptomyces sp. NPDC058525]|uniref:hypothetical protein n=1 Tax=Streptomyces sp. NPDC058525 TaxID=3346538 RepID=UPI003665086B